MRQFQEDPTPVLELLELLKDDPSLYVRRSVANNLNDIGKDHPEVLVETTRRWMAGASEDRQWLIRHALRSAIKRGNQGALAVLGYGDSAPVEVTDAEIMPTEARIGGSVRIAFTITNVDVATAKLNVDLRVWFMKANGRTSPKVFKVRGPVLPAGGSARLSKVVSLRQHTTRTHHPGMHPVEVVVNGVSRPIGSFVITRSAPT